MFERQPVQMRERCIIIGTSKLELGESQKNVFHSR
jgi:hypothetical protein